MNHGNTSLPTLTDRVAALAEVERAVRQVAANCSYRPGDGCDFCNGVDAALEQVRRLAAEAQRTESVPPAGAQDREAPTHPAYLRAVVLSALAGCGVQVPAARAQAAAETVLVHLADAQQPGGGAVRVTSGSSERRDRYAAAVRHLHETGGLYALDAGEDGRIADAVTPVADAEQHAVYRLLSESRIREARLREENEGLDEALRGAISAAEKDSARLRGERDRAREVEVRLENQLAAILGECDAIDSDVHGKNPVALAGMRDAVARIRAVHDDEPTPGPAPTALKHRGGNAEDCPACHDTNPPYPFLCPGPGSEEPPC
ncbi:hypothetical protein [Streptomyces qinglanensis]|uniref:Uncharacterized protein n=1 Tax=Streptomyces qinglanensis TaxID=943816 RepID=A0A1H9U3H7_9ACTN|nr:hypothetical protein [Streptomyces qinglanensis]SES03996.1 hypothetical protein SAMN05421870_107293 [Streptomyces qinglanensis]